ncbi:MAG: FAD:protein FMN transferase [Planctomycetes bacterium]|nr:FAD:protein FMN transferase [Planctomycetota bacterium]
MAPLTALLCLVPLLQTTAPQQPAAGPQRFHFQEVHLGAPVEITLYAQTEPAARVAARAAFDEIAQWESALSDYSQESEVARLPKSVGAPVHVGPRLAKALSLSMEFHLASGGAFDPALGRLTTLWRTAFRTSAMPSAAELADAREHSGARHIAWDAAAGTVALKLEGVQLDFGGIGQGLAADGAMAALRAQGVSSALIDISGDILAGDPPPGAEGWRVRVEPEFPGGVVRSFVLANRALCVSGDRGQPGHIDGKTFSHILDPATGAPIDTPRQSVALAPSAAVADALATIACVMPTEKLRTFAKQYPDAEIAIERKPRDGGTQWIQRGKR